CQHPAEIVAYSNFLGQLADAGNTTTLSDYRLLLDDAYFLKTLQKFSGSTVRSRASKPKWLICDNALVTAFSDWPPQEILRSSTWGRWIENAVLNHLTRIVDSEVYYWREKDAEVDAVVKVGGTLYALEVKAGSHLRTKSGLNAFVRRFSKAMPLIVGAGGIPIEDFLASSEWRWGN
ncbi:MAG: DUF4143 domain-containing protein, partial [Phycisphaerae bacterium]|nr:DUF4143 domain-containing protein [Phycisphaerae bacterium]